MTANAKHWLRAAALAIVCLAQVLDALASPAEDGADPLPQEKQCMARGWQRVAMDVGGLPRTLLWKGPAGKWTRGAILVLHGGGGHHFQFCVANARIVEPQVRFAELALAQGFAVFLLESSDRITDREGRPCGKAWDDEVRERSNLDLPFVATVVREVVARKRPAGSEQAVFITGLSSGGYMTARAAVHFGDLFAAFAPVSSGDPFGWHRVCKAGTTPRDTVHGAGFDNETGRQITERDACLAERYPNERLWDVAATAGKPMFRLFRHAEDGINDRSCGEKLGRQLRERGYAGDPDFVLTGGSRSLANHLWLEAYNQPILDFFNRVGERR
jgi:poly(3-hydroxybutyrate) depolymerase